MPAPPPGQTAEPASEPAAAQEVVSQLPSLRLQVRVAAGARASRIAPAGKGLVGRTLEIIAATFVKRRRTTSPHVPRRFNHRGPWLPVSQFANPLGHSFSLRGSRARVVVQCSVATALVASLAQPILIIHGARHRARLGLHAALLRLPSGPE